MAELPLIGVSRHRMETDGAGVTTLVASWGCPLRCKMCINPHAWKTDTRIYPVTARRLFDALKIDDLYFQATGGGVTFGGGEPLLHAEFIREFRALCQDRWRLTVESCLNVPPENLYAVTQVVDHFIVDIKDMRREIYRQYTGGDNARALENLSALLQTVGPGRVTVRVPNIPGYNTPADVAVSVERLRAMGFETLDVFSYRVPETSPQPSSTAGKP